MRAYRTGFEAQPDDYAEPEGPFRGSGWIAELVPVVSSVSQAAGFPRSCFPESVYSPA